MDHLAEHDTTLERPEELRLSLEELEKAVNTTPAKGVPKPLFIAVTVLAVVLGVLLALLCFFDSDYRHNMALMNADQEFMRQELEQANTDLASAQEKLAQAQNELTQAQETIDTLKEYSVAAPDGTVPEYTRLYPDLYAPEWTGQAVTDGRVCCLTFDDGPSANTDRVLELLDRYGIQATFFVVGTSAATPAGQERMKQIVAAGHALGMHSWSHDYKTISSSVDAFLADFDRLYQYIYEVTGARPSVYRFPGGSLNGYDRGVYQEIVAEMARRGFVYYDWNASAQDATAVPRPAWEIAADCLRGVGRELVVVLCHDSAARGTTVDALPAVIEGYQRAGYTFSSLHPGVEQVTFGYPKIR